MAYNYISCHSSLIPVNKSGMEDYLTAEEKDLMERVLSSNTLHTKELCIMHAEECLPDRYKLIDVTTDITGVEEFNELNPEAPAIIFKFRFTDDFGIESHTIFIICVDRDWWNEHDVQIEQL